MTTANDLELEIPQEKDDHPAVKRFLNRVEKNNHIKFSAKILLENYEAVRTGLLGGLARLGRSKKPAA